MNQLPNNFLALTHEGIHRVTISAENVYNLDALIAKFAAEKQMVFPRIAELPFGMLHLATRSSSPPSKMAILELSAGTLVIDTLYHPVKREEEEWVSPCFIPAKNSFPLRCGFEFKHWYDAGLRLFLSVGGLSGSAPTIQFWLYYDGQIYRPPFGNIFDASYQICMGHNEAALAQALSHGLSDWAKLSGILKVLSATPWNADTFHHSDVSVLDELVRFDSAKIDLPMLPPRNPARIKDCPVAANKELAEITAKIVTYV